MNNCELMKIPFNRPTNTGHELEYIANALSSEKISGDGYYGKQCAQWFNNYFPGSRSLLVPSCTAALELSAILIDIRSGDEVILPSYTFVSTANAFILRGAKVIFVDVEPDTMNIDPACIESAITPRTKAIVVVHYGGLSCDMDQVASICKEKSIFLIEDAAQALTSSFNGKNLGSFGDISCFSFHETKNITSGGEGGAIIINNPKLQERAEIIREKGTNRSQFFKGQVDKYTWVDIGSSFLPSEIQAAYLWAQLENLNKIQTRRQYIWKNYYELIENLELSGEVELPCPQDKSVHNAHLFYIKLETESRRDEFIKFMQSRSISCVFHYIPLHSSPYGLEHTTFHGIDKYTTRDSKRLVRLPVYFNMTDQELLYISESIKAFFG